MTLVRRPLRVYRCPTLVERFLFGITCIGFCEVNEKTEDPDKWLAACERFCAPKLPYPTLQTTLNQKALPPKR